MPSPLPDDDLGVPRLAAVDHVLWRLSQDTHRGLEQWERAYEAYRKLEKLAGREVPYREEPTLGREARNESKGRMLPPY
jgi:hypothetical protein